MRFSTTYETQTDTNLIQEVNGKNEIILLQDTSLQHVPDNH
jgi:hypothetical protein